MKTSRRRLLTALIAVVVIAGFVVSLYQPWLAQWGSTGTERNGRLAGDEIVTGAHTSWTRSITIDAPPDRVWPWLVQMGVDKAGFYNYDWGEQLANDPIHNATTIHPEWQDLRAGDAVHPMPGSDWEVVVLDPPRTLVLANPAVTPTDWTWATELRPLDGDRTRVVTRIRNHKGSAFSYGLDTPDLILFPRLLTGLGQRAEGTLPGMPGTHTGRPFPLARLPVHTWAALAWLVGLGALALLLRRPLGFGNWGHRRRHPHLTFWCGFVVGAGYLLMSDTPPVQFFTHHWALGVAAGAAAGVLVLRRRAVGGGDGFGRHVHVVSRAITAGVESGLFLLLPALAVWQAATARGWTTSWVQHLAIGVVAAAAATVIGGAAWSAHGRAWLVPAALAIAFAATGSGLAVFVAALVVEFGTRRSTTPGEADEALALLEAASRRREPVGSST